MNSYDDIPTSVLAKAAGMSGLGAAPQNYRNPNFIERVQPATSMPLPGGPANFPVRPAAPANQALPNDTNGLLKALIDEVRAVRDVGLRILEEMIRQGTAARPVIRAKDVTAAGQTLNWQSVGIMDRLMLKNNGADTVWFAFDMNGPAVNAFTSDLSFSLKADSTVNLSLSLFTKVGVKCAAGKTATVDAVAWQSVAGNQAAAIS